MERGVCLTVRQGAWKTISATTVAAYRCRLYDSLANQWVTWEELVPAETLHRGLAVQLERKGFWVLDRRQEV